MFDASKNLATESQAQTALQLAKVHAESTTKPMKSSAVECLNRAQEFFDRKNFGYAHEWAVESLRYSIGILHPDFEKAKKAETCCATFAATGKHFEYCRSNQDSLVWNVMVPVVALVSAPTKDEAIEKLKQRIIAKGMIAYDEEDDRIDAFPSEPGTEADF